MMNIKLALFVSVSAYALQINPVYASLLSSLPASILDTNIHTPARVAAHPQGVASQTCHNVQSSAPASFSSLILGLDPRIQVKQGFLSHLDASVKHWHDSSFLTASVCFITDTGACSGNSFGGGANTEDGGHGAPGGGSGDNGGTGDDGKDPDYELDNAERCKKEGYTLTSCNSVQDSVNHCPYDNSYFEKCVCKSDLVTCTKPQYGVGEACGGKYASCETDNPRACKEDGYTNTCVTGQKLRKDKRCQYDSSFGICCTESCAANTSLTCTGANAGDDGCGYTCKQCCVTSCPSGYDYSESQLTGANGTGWVKDGTDYCDHCTKGRLYKRKAATCPSTSNKTCGCGGSDKCKSGNNTYYSSCNCCSNCSGATSHSGMAYYNSCYNSCTKQTLYTERSCDNYCSPDEPSSCEYGYETYQNECGTTCYSCYGYWHGTGYISVGIAGDGSVCTQQSNGQWSALIRIGGVCTPSGTYSNLRCWGHYRSPEGSTKEECESKKFSDPRNDLEWRRNAVDCREIWDYVDYKDNDTCPN